eukprot:7073083-Pyramimonas_sp.AAC.1
MRGVSLAAKLQYHAALIESKLMHNAGTWGQLSERSKQQLEAAYYGSLRRAVKCQRRQDTVSGAEVLLTCQRAPLGRLM